MKKILLIAMAVMIGFASFADGSFSVNYSQSSDSERQLSFTLGNYSIENTVINGQNFSKIVFDHSVVTNQKGWAELPFLNSSVQISNQKNVTVDVANSDFIDITLDYPLVPSRGTIYRNQDPSTLPYVIDPASVNDTWYPKSITSSEEPFILRDVRGANVKVYPFQYNAASNTLRVYTQVTVNVNDNNSPAINPKTRTSVKVLQEMDAMYNSIFVNYASHTREALPIGDFGDILVVTTERDEVALQPFIDWKMEKGFNVFKEVVATGTNVKTLIQEAYDNNPNIMYVQLSGDWADIKCDLGGGANAPMDPMLGCVEGTDVYPEIAIGRFSGSSPAHITVQVDKAINYEKNPEVDGTWYSKSFGLASDEGAGSGDDGEQDKVHVQNIFDYRLEPFTYDEHYGVYAPSANVGQVIDAINSGVSIANYTGHGSETTWVTTGFSNSNIANLTNENKLPFIFSVACVNGAFHSGECFGEAWLKKENGGAVMALMATINQPWQPPMRGQDYFNDILTGGYDYTTNTGNGTSTEEGRTFLGSIVVNGLNLMYAESSGGDDLETIQTWTTFGDCSLQPRTIAPMEISLSNETIISGIDFTTTVTVDGNTMPGAMVALSQAGNDLYYSAIADENGEVTIEHELTPGDAKFVVTAMNTQTIYETVQIISPEGPYLVIDDFEVNTADGLVIYDSEISMDVAFKNLGADPATGVTVTITSDNSDYCTLLSGTTITIGDVDADEMITMEDAFSFAIADNTPDQFLETLTFEINGADEMWEDNVSFKINAPALNIVFAEIDDATGDGNGRLDAGETAILKFNANNDGHAASPEANMTIATSSPYITLNATTANIGLLDAEGTAMAEFEITVADDAPLGELANFSTDMAAGNYSTSNSVMLPLGLVIEDWESGDFAQYDWAFSGNADWTIIEGSDVYEGTYSAKSGVITHSQSSIMQIDVTAASESLVSFYSKVSSEGGYDYLKFFIDGDEIEKWSGTEAWAMHEYTCPAGEHTLKWEYYKDNMVSSGSDCAWVDYIVLPGASSSAPLFADFAADQQDICDGEMVEFTSNSVGTVTTYNWTFEGGEPATSTEENPTVVYATAGTYNVSLTIGDGTNENTMTKEAYITTHNCTGLGDVQAFNMEVYPNPNNGQFTIKLNQSAKVEIISAVGHTVYSSQLIGKETIDLSSQAEGVYFVKVETETESKVEKVVVRK